MDAYTIMHQWDAEAGIEPRSDEDLDHDVPAGLTGNYDEWMMRLESGDVAAILEGRQCWGLPALV